MTEYKKLPITAAHPSARPHSSVGHTEFYQTEHLMIKLDAAIEGVMTQRNSSAIIEPISLRGHKHMFSFECNINFLKHMDALKEGDILLFQDQIFGMDIIDIDKDDNKTYYLHIGINRASQSKMKLFIIRRFDILNDINKSMVTVVDGHKWRDVTNREYNMIMNKVCRFEKWSDNDIVSYEYRKHCMEEGLRVANTEYKRILKSTYYPTYVEDDEDSEYDEKEEDLDRMIIECAAHNILLKKQLEQFREDMANDYMEIDDDDMSECYEAMETVNGESVSDRKRTYNDYYDGEYSTIAIDKRAQSI